MHITFEGKTLIVTGAASGIGLAIAESLAASGARVVLADLRLADARREADRLAEAGHLAHPFAADVSREHDMEGLVAFAEEVGGALHGVVNNAGIGGVSAPTGTYPVDNWRQVIDINLTGVFFGIRYAVPALKRAGGGAIVNVASILGSVGLAQSPAYVAAKHGVLGLTKAAALAHAADHIRINAIGPGFISTPLVDRSLDAATKAQLAGLHALKRFGTPAEVASLATFLLSDQASFITGSYHLVDGGYTAQ